MSEPVTLNESEQTIIPAHKARIRLARYISHIFSPAPIALPFILLVAFHNSQNSFMSTLGYAGMTFLFLALGPFLYILVGVLQGKFTDIDVSVRSQRTGPFLFTILCAVLGLVTCWLISAPRHLETLIITMILTCILLMITTLWWKISIHATVLGSCATFLTSMYGPSMLPSFLLLLLVCWSRVVLQRHTIPQVIGGSLASILITLLAITLGGF